MSINGTMPGWSERIEGNSWGLPALTLPFVFATLTFVLLKGASTELEPVEVADITTPEEHLTRSLSKDAGAGCRARRRTGLVVN